MRVLLVNPGMDMTKLGTFAGLMDPMPVVGMAYLAAVCERDGHDLQVIDQFAARMTAAQVAQQAASFGAEVLGVSVLTPTALDFVRLSAAVRQTCPDIVVVAGNIHADVFAQQMLSDGDADFVVHGEGEETLSELLRVLDSGGADDSALGDVLGLSWRDSAGEVKRNAARPRIADLDALPWPAWHRFPYRSYGLLPLADVARPTLAMTASRGCPYRCARSSGSDPDQVLGAGDWSVEAGRNSRRRRCGLARRAPAGWTTRHRPSGMLPPNLVCPGVSMRWWPLLLLVGCAAAPEPLDLPEDPAATGVPVGVRSVVEDYITLEVWYPASDDVEGEAPPLNVEQYLPPVVVEYLGFDLEFPVVPLTGIRDAAIRVPVEPYPVVIFSHGFGGFREQSPDYAQHLASRGYVVISADHPGRMLGDVLPCLFSPSLDGCNFTGFGGGDDPAVGHVITTLGWLEGQAAGGWLEGVVDLERIGLSGHSAGGGTTATVGEIEDRFSALIVEAAPTAADRDVPQLVMAGTCDEFATGPEAVEAAAAAPNAAALEILGAGHMAFANLCSLRMDELAEEILEPRDDINEFFLDGMLDLVTSGCPGGAVPEGIDDCAAGYLDFDVGTRVIRHHATRFWDEHLYGVGPGLEVGADPAARLTVSPSM